MVTNTITISHTESNEQKWANLIILHFIILQTRVHIFQGTYFPSKGDSQDIKDNFRVLRFDGNDTNNCLAGGRTEDPWNNSIWTQMMTSLNFLRLHYPLHEDEQLLKNRQSFW